MVAGMFGQLGYDVLRTRDAAGALRALDNGGTVNLVFSDIVMPGGMVGVALACQLRSRRPELPVVLTSGHPGTAFGELATIGLRVLAKPYGLDELRAALQQAVQLVDTRHMLSAKNRRASDMLQNGNSMANSCPRCNAPRATSLDRCNSTWGTRP
jgi:DNA-binding NtrC family response regulator